MHERAGTRALPEDLIDVDALLEHTRKHVAGYKVPKRIVPVESVNRAPNGKVDHKALRAVAVSYIS